MKQLFITFGLLFIIGFSTTIGYQQEHNNKKGSLIDNRCYPKYCEFKFL